MKKSQLSSIRSRDQFVKYICDKYHSILYLYALGLCQRFKIDASYAKDLLQEFYFNVLAKWEIIKNGYEEKEVGYLCQTIYNRFRDLGRQQQSRHRREKHFSDHQVIESGDIHCMNPQIHSERFFQEMGNMLKPEDCQIMQLYIYGYSYKEIGIKMNKPSNTIGTRIRRARQRLKKLLH